MKTNPKSILSIRLDDKLREKLQYIAKKQNRSLSNLIETVLNEYVLKYEKDNHEIINNVGTVIGTLTNDHGHIVFNKNDHKEN